jgi:hypothetical protein
MSSSIDYSQPQGHDFQFLPDTAQLISPWSNLSGAQSSSSVANSIRGNGHHREHSNSTIGSIYGGQAQTSTKSQNHRHSRGVGSLPTPTQTPTKTCFPPPSQSNLENSIATSMAMSQGLSQSHHPMDSMSHIPRQFSMGEPMTPMTAVSNDFHDDGRRQYQSGENDSDIDAWLADYLLFEDMTANGMVPKFERTMTDAYNDELYMGNMPNSTQAPSTSYLMPQSQNPMVQERLHDARMARTTSASTNQSMPLSPFKNSSPFMPSPGAYSQSNPSTRQKRPNSPLSATTPKTISPQEAMLDYKPHRDDVPLFNQTRADYNSYAAIAPSTSKSPYQNVQPMTYGPQAWSTDLQQATIASAPMPNFNFVAPALPTNLSGISNPYLGKSAALSSRSASRQNEQPEFPAHLTSMESSASEAPASSASTTLGYNSPKPTASAAESGTYSCTYHGCTQRFATPRELQKHKRDIHRSNPHVTPGVGSGMSAQQIMDRNSQSGPHRCDRINPTTGKSCNTNFSRPYDLTRHEDTIHNQRKVKLRCVLCTEEKLFSRNDALTRHMRVVHPEQLDFQPRRRRRHD